MSDTIADKEREVEQTREELADTVDALHDKLDIKSKAQARLKEARSLATNDAGRPKPVVLAGVLAVLGLVVGLVWWRRS
jgi:ElaB/YqjD/DUF883 family membrane-anchored ribosome-binding protein